MAVRIGFPPVVFPSGRDTLVDLCRGGVKLSQNKQDNPLSESLNHLQLCAAIRPLSLN